MGGHRQQAAIVVLLLAAVAPRPAIAADDWAPALFGVSYLALGAAELGLGVYDLATINQPPNRAAAIVELVIAVPELALSGAVIGLAANDLANPCTGCFFRVQPEVDAACIGVGAFTGLLSVALIAHGAVALRRLGEGAPAGASTGADRGVRWALLPVAVPGERGAAGLVIAGRF